VTALPYGHQEITAEDVAAVERVLKSDHITQGPEIEAFERELAHKCGAKYAVAVSSGTAALHIGALSLGLAPGSVLWTSPNSFVASSNCAYYCGAEVDFVDIEEETGNMSVAALAEKLTGAQRKGRLPDVVVPVHFAGQPCDMEEILALARVYNFRVMVDACHAIGAQYQGKPLAENEADLTVLSFHPVKVVTTGEGGALLTNSEDLFRRLCMLRSHGVSRNDEYASEFDGPWSYVQVELGFNYRITDIQAALGLNQLDRLEAYVSRRNDISAAYDDAFNGHAVTPLTVKQDRLSARHLYVVRLASSDLRRRVFEQLQAEQIRPQVHYIPIHTQPYYRSKGFKRGDFPVAEWHYDRSITLPLFPAMTGQDQERVIAGVLRVLETSRS